MQRLEFTDETINWCAALIKHATERQNWTWSNLETPSPEYQIWKYARWINRKIRVPFNQCRVNIKSNLDEDYILSGFILFSFSFFFFFVASSRLFVIGARFTEIFHARNWKKCEWNRCVGFHADIYTSTFSYFHSF